MKPLRSTKTGNRNGGRAAMKAGAAVAAFSLALALLPAAPAMAASGTSQRGQVSTSFPPGSELLQMYTPDQIQQVRDQLKSIIDIQLQLRGLLGRPESASKAAVLKQAPDKIKDTDIARWLFAGADLAPLETAYDKAMATTQAAILARQARTESAPSPLSDFPTPQYCSDCNGFSSDGNVVFAYATALNAAQFVWIPLNRACEEDVLGENTSLACIIADEILQTAQFIFDEYTLCDGDTQGSQVAASWAGLQYINGQIDQDYQAIIANSNTNRDQIIANDNTNRDMIIANDNANTALVRADILSLRVLTVRLAVEQAVAAGGSAQYPLALLELPTANGGYLETVRDTVTQDIASLSAAGQNVGVASSNLNMGNNYYAMGRYKMAFYYFRLAYQNASASN